MRICIPTAEPGGLNAPVHGHFGSASCYTIYATDGRTAEVVVNSDQHHAHGMCQPLAALAGQNIDAVVCAGIGAGALHKLNAVGIKVYRAAAGTAGEIAQRYLRGELEEITPAGACASHSGH
jgi:predicted Fe-Mo cluster-binding NifX family protein